MSNETLEQIAEHRKLRIHEPFAEFLNSGKSMYDFEVSLLDCYRMAGHACHAITGAFLITEAAVLHLFPDTKICERGDLKIGFPSELNEGATGPKSNVISFITGAWADSGFPGLKGEFVRKNLMSYGNGDVPKNAIRFTRLSTGKSVLVQYSPDAVLNESPSDKPFPEKWRIEIHHILEKSEKTIQITHESSSRTCSSDGVNGCC